MPGRGAEAAEVFYELHVACIGLQIKGGFLCSKTSLEEPQTLNSKRQTRKAYAIKPTWGSNNLLFARVLTRKLWYHNIGFEVLWFRVFG